MILGEAIAQPMQYADFIVLMGQSNMLGRRDNPRLANTLYNYQGIAAYPATRTTEPVYVADPSDVYIYRKPGINTSDQVLDDGQWEAYEAGTNSGNRPATPPLQWGPEISAGVRLTQYTGRPVYMVKCAYGGTGLSRINTGSAAPGNWNPQIRAIAALYFIARAVRDFKAANPTIRPRLIGVMWWQGEEDGQMGITKAQYKAAWAEFKTYMERTTNGVFVIDKPPVWIVTRLRYLETAGEAAINLALEEIAAEATDVHIVDCAPYPKGNKLTTAEAAPMAVGTPNSGGDNDDNHMSYIGRMAVGELYADVINSNFFTL
jgi:hypothetical protein